MSTNKGYTTVSDPDTSAKALAKDQPVSPKFAREVAGMIRGMKVEVAVKALEDVIAEERPVPLKRYNKRVSHKAGVGPGRYPVKASRAILGVVRAQHQTLSTKDLSHPIWQYQRSLLQEAKPSPDICPGHREGLHSGIKRQPILR